MLVRSFKDLVVWRKAFALCVALYKATEGFPRDERFGIAQEAKKTARSVLYNIAEGHRRRSTLDYLRFLDISCGSAAELETQLLLSVELGFLTQSRFEELASALREVDVMLDALKGRLRQRAAQNPRPLGPSAPRNPGSKPTPAR
jgi:four helix bundle protein